MQVKKAPRIGRYANGKSEFMIPKSNKMPREMGAMLTKGTLGSEMFAEEEGGVLYCPIVDCRLAAPLVRLREICRESHRKPQWD